MVVYGIAQELLCTDVEIDFFLSIERSIISHGKVVNIEFVN